MKLTKRLQYARDFATFCERVKISPNTLAQIVHHVEASKAAWERENSDYASTHPEYVIQQMKKNGDNQYRANLAAKSEGFTLDWPGLYALLVDVNGQQHHIPY